MDLSRSLELQEGLKTSMEHFEIPNEVAKSGTFHFHMYCSRTHVYYSTTNYPYFAETWASL